jgi:hypothetical protein
VGWNRSERRLGRELRKHRPEPRSQFVQATARDLGARSHRSSLPRVAFAGGLTAALLVALGAVGGIGYAANSASQAVNAVKHVFVAATPRASLSVSGNTSGSDGYRPGYGYGDKNHVHTGPPGLGNGKGGANLPPLTARKIKGAKAQRVSFPLAVDEQVHLFIHVLGPDGKELLLSQKSPTSVGGNKLTGPESKTLNYAVLIPRTLPITLRIPSSLLQSGKTYQIKIIAVSPLGESSTFTQPFRAA